MVSQIINLSNNNSFKLYKERYNFSIQHNHGLLGIEVRNIPGNFFNSLALSSSQVIYCSNDSMLLVGSINQIQNEINKSSINQNLREEVTQSIINFDRSESIVYSFNNKEFDFKNCFVMGILNVTPDSFSDGGKYTDKEKAVDYALEMIEKGVDVIDVGGESTRPGSDSITEKVEIERVVPVIEGIIKRKPEAVISIDTTKSNVAEAALMAGASIVNDISGGTFDKNIFNIVSQFDAGLILMHIKDKPKTMQLSPMYNDVVSEVYDHLSMQCKQAKDSGIKKIFVDPGVGFGKRLEDNLTLINRLEDFKSLGFPILIGLSRKSFIGNILNLAVEDRDDVTNSLNTLVIDKGARVIRTHNIKLAVQTCKMFNRLLIN